MEYSDRLLNKHVTTPTCLSIQVGHMRGDLIGFVGHSCTTVLSFILITSYSEIISTLNVHACVNEMNVVLSVYFRLSIFSRKCDELLAACANSETGVSYQPSCPPWERKVEWRFKSRVQQPLLQFPQRKWWSSSLNYYRVSYGSFIF